jgi:protein TonB
MPLQSLLLQPAPASRDSRSSLWIPLSLGLHVFVIAALLFHRPQILKATQLPGDRNGHQLLLTYLPGQGTTAPASPNTAPRHPIPNRLPRLHVPAPPPPAAAPAPPAALTGNSSTGVDTLGEGDIQIASMLLHPRPQPDLSTLPAGTSGDVIVDIVIDTKGRVAKTTMEHGLGPSVDQTVLATVQQWTFQPATRNGIPIASEQELLFHYERA